MPRFGLQWCALLKLVHGCLHRRGCSRWAGRFAFCGSMNKDKFVFALVNTWPAATVEGKGGLPCVVERLVFMPAKLASHRRFDAGIFLKSSKVNCKFAGDRMASAMGAAFLYSWVKASRCSQAATSCPAICTLRSCETPVLANRPSRQGHWSNGLKKRRTSWPISDHVSVAATTNSASFQARLRSKGTHRSWPASLRAA